MNVDWSMAGIDALRLLAALLAGSIIGIEREFAGKVAGFRTNALICAGSALFTAMSLRLGQYPDADPTRIASQIVTGVGFLGAGAILHGRGSVIGLTTAATIWTVAAVGVAFGAGYYVLGAVATVAVALVLFGFGQIERLLVRLPETWTPRLIVDGDGDAAGKLRDLIGCLGVEVQSWSVTSVPEGSLVVARLRGRRTAIEDLRQVFTQDPQIRAWLEQD